MQSSQTKNNAVFFRIGPFPIPNKILAEELPKQFPGVNFIVIDVVKEIKKRPLVMVTNLLVSFMEYGDKIISRDFKIKDAFLGTTYIYWWIKRFTNKIITNANPLFTFQSESLWDVSKEGVPNFVYTDHTHLANLAYPSFKKSKLRPQKWIELERIIYKNASTIFTRSSNITKSLIEQYNTDNEKILKVGAGSNFNKLNLNYVKDDYEDKNILFVGIDWLRKGGPDLVKAFEIVLKKHPDAKLTIVGATPDVNLPNCTIIPRIPVEEVSKYYEKASIFCLPTKQEPFGIVFIEALHYKLPIVATNIGAIPDFVKNNKNGYLVSPESPEELAEKLILLLDDPNLCKSMGENGFELARSFYNWEKVTERMAERIKSKY
ncbi:MAG: glycosyltransferase family 4 protein [Anaerolineales bacterium]